MAAAFLPRGELLKAALRALALLAVALALLAGSGAWLCTAPQGARLTARVIATLSGGRVAIENVQGSLAGPLRIGRLALRTSDKVIVLHDLNLVWRAAELWRGRLHIRSLDLARLEIQTLRPAATPLHPPASLRLPLSLRVDRLTVGEIAVGAPASPTLLHDLVAGIDDRGGRYELAVHHLATPWAVLRGTATLGAASPFPLAARLTLVRATPRRLTVDARVSGSLLAPRLSAQASGGGLSLDLAGAFHPFAALPIASLELHSHAVDLRALATRAPATSLDISATLVSSGLRTLAGKIALRNDLSGPLDRGRLPLVSAGAVVKIQPALVEISSLQADLGPAGKITGSARWQRGVYALELDSPALDLAGLDSRFFPSRYATTVTSGGDPRQQHLQISARQGSDRLDASLQRRADRVELSKLAARLHGATLDAHGSLALSAARSFAFQARLAAFDPAAFGRFPRGNLNARLAATGILTPHPVLEARLSLPGGHLAGRPVSGTAQIRLAWPRVPAIHADLNLAGNRLALAGAWGGAHDQLHWNLDAPRLDRLGFGLAGRLRSAGQITGSWPHPAAALSLDGSGLHLPHHLRAAALHVDVHAARGLDGPLHVQAAGQGLGYGKIDVEQSRLALTGTLAHHRLTIQAQLPQTRVDLAAAGGYAQDTWTGEITTFDARGKPPFNAHLQAPAQLVVGPRLQRLMGARFTLAGGEADITLLQHGPEGFASRGRLAHFPVAPLLALAARPLPFASDLVVEGAWNLAYGRLWQGELHLARSQGDIVLQDPRRELGLTALDLRVAGVGQQLQGKLKANTRSLGQMDIDGWMSQPPRGVPWPWPASTALDMHARGDFPTLAILGPTLPPGAQLDARTTFDLRASGTLAAADLSGRISARAITASFPDVGLRVKDGTLDLALAHNRIQVNQGWLAGEQGRVLISGGGDWQQGGALLNLDFENFALLTRPDAQATVSGATRLELRGGRLTVGGNLKVVRARISTIDAGRPRLSGDVIVQGRPHRPAKPATALPVSLALSLDLGEDFQVKAYGLDALLQGRLTLTGSGLPAATGNVQVTRGTYTAYGQRLTIARGRISFFGPLDNPALDILAVRQTGQVTAGVTLAGTAQQPRVNLYSDPAMPDSETLSWLLFGHGPGNLSNEQFSLLQAAASALLARGGGTNLQTKLAEKLGLSSIDIQGGGASNGNLAGTVVSVGKQLSRSFRLRYEQSLDGLTQIVRAYYALSPSLSLQAQTGSQSGVDVLYSREFE